MRVQNGFWMAFASIAAAQTVTPSNSSSDLTDSASSPRFYINPSGTTQFPAFLVAPLGRYAAIDRRTFMGISFSGVLTNTDPTTVSQINSNDFNFVSCDPEHYEGGNIDASSMLRIIANQRGSPTSDKSSLIFYSVRSNHCSVSDFTLLPLINGVFTTVDPTVASQVANMNFTTTSNAVATLTPDRSAFWQNTSGYSGQPTTAVAMIILYSITGVITALFVIIIITGAVRAHRHPERYGPRASPGQSRQSRAKGIARAMLETLPIVKFGDHTNLPKDKNASAEDIELAHPGNSPSDGTTAAKVGAKSATITTSAVGDVAETTSKPKSDTEGFSNADGSDEAGVLGCSICTEDFHKGEEVRVLPCNHKFHPECVDPWLLNVSGTCPLCRISLTPEGEQTQSPPDTTNENMPPPLASNPPPGDRRSQAIHNLMAMAYGSRDERLIALRRYRSDRRGRNPSQPQVNEEERISRSRRFREAFRIRTRRHEVNETEAQMRNSGVAAVSGGQMRF